MRPNKSVRERMAMNRKSTSSVLRQVGVEVGRAMTLHQTMNSPHEAYARILEELDEFKYEVFMKAEDRSNVAMRKGLVQVAAMVVRAIVDLDLNLNLDLDL